MNRPAAIFLLIVFLPLAFMVWLGERVAEGERALVRQEFRKTLYDELKAADRRITGLIEERERECARLTDISEFDTAALRAAAADCPFASQFFVLNADGSLLYPAPDSPLTPPELEFLQRTAAVISSQALLNPPAPADDGAPPPQFGWHAHHGEAGLQLLFWRRLPAGQIAGVELDQARLTQDIVARLPQGAPFENGNPPSAQPASLALLDSNGQIVALRGGYPYRAGDDPRMVVPLSPPLNSWRLEYHAPITFTLGRGYGLSLTAAIAAVVVFLAALALYFYRGYTEEVREALQRMNFANQVSHELKTPLTNIRMYAELLEAELPEDEGPPAAGARHYLGVIVAESQRLSRLIGNVLTFARQQRRALALQPRPGVIDATLAETLDQFRPALATKGVALVFHPSAPARVRFDPDALEQILGNLCGNVEKYAASGGLLEIASAQSGSQTVITASDRGPGIPPEQREKIFQPFYRLSNKLTDGVAGTGIGLTIARDLARLHGGDLTVEVVPLAQPLGSSSGLASADGQGAFTLASPQTTAGKPVAPFQTFEKPCTGPGACFKLTLFTPPEEE